MATKSGCARRHGNWGWRQVCDRAGDHGRWSRVPDLFCHSFSMTRLDQLRAPLADPQSHPDEPELRARAGLILDWLLRHHSTLPDQAIGRSASVAEMEALL